jgi:hypothetical protein
MPMARAEVRRGATVWALREDVDYGAMNTRHTVIASAEVRRGEHGGILLRSACIISAER